MSDEQYRFECEGRYWLSVTGGNAGKIDALMERIEKKRGRAAAKKLRQGMRDEYRKQREAGQK